MPTDLDLIVRTVLREEEEDRAANDAKIAAALADPVLRGVIDRVAPRYAHVFTEKGMERARRVLALVFTTDPRAAALLAKLREQAMSGAIHTGATAEQRKTKP
jgi:hypothetical protein